MFRNIFFLLLLVCLSLTSFSQKNGSKRNAKDSAKMIEAATEAAAQSKDQKKDEAEKKADENKRGEITADYVDSLKNVIKESATTQKENEKIIKKQEEDIKKLSAGNDKNESTSSPTILSWAIGALAVLLVLVLFLFFKNQRLTSEDRRKRKLLENYSNDLEKIKTNENTRSQAMNAEIDSLKNRLRETVKEDTVLQNPPAQTQTPASSVQFIPYVTTTPKSFIKSEIILSAGPRKDNGNNDTELGEDVAGAVSFPNQTFFWILDGTSDSAAIKSLGVEDNTMRHEEVHIFSSRLLAQNIGYYIQKNIRQCLEDKLELNELMTRAIAHVSAEWEKRLNNELPEKKGSILQLIRKGFKPLCSTTVIMGRLLDDGNLYALRTGDSKLFPFKKANGQLTLDKTFKFTADPTDEYDRIAFRLDVDEASQSFIIKQNIPKWLTQSTDNVDYVFAFTDGIGRVTEAQLASDNPGIVEMIRQNIARIPQKTYDDKTLVILERVIMN